jgi:adenosylmethionine-8-amino-7-oxononanoate aminotransferase
MIEVNEIPEKDLLAFDREHIWHPYSTMINPPSVFRVASASGVRLKLDDGRELIDGMSSWWSAIHGYNHPVLNKAAKDQIDNMAHVMFGGLTHKPAIELASLLVDLTPESLQKVFFCDSGSVSVEAAIKMAVQYWHSNGRPEKNKLLTIRSGYHGDTFMAMSVCDPLTGMHHLFNRILPEQYFADAPECRYGQEWDERDILSFKGLIEKHHNRIAAVILEPVVQGTGGMRFYSTEYLRMVRALCDEYDVLLIFDEIATGFGRAGKFFACELASVAPDIMCVGKAMTGGYLTLAAAITTDKIAYTISDNGNSAFMHGPTYMANPLACAVAIASIKLLLSYPYEDMLKRIEQQLKEELQVCAHFPSVADVRCLGAIGVVELNKPVDMNAITKRFIERGVWIRPFGRLVYIMPPFIIEPEDLSKLTRAVAEVVMEEG